MTRPPKQLTGDADVAARMPQNENAELAVLGCLLLHPETFVAYREQIDPADFADFNRRFVYLKMIELGASHCLLVAGALAETDRPELAAYASQVMEQACTPGQVPTFLGVLKLKSVERRRISCAELISIRGRDGDTEGMAAAIAQLNEIHDYQPPGEEVKAMCARNLLAKKIVPREYLLEPLLTTSSLAEIFSWRGVGKTWFGLSFAGAVSAGTSFLSWKAPKARKTLYVDGELSEFELQQRIRLLGIDNENFMTICTDALENPFPHLATSQAQRAIEANLAGVELLILDNLSALAPSTNENESEQWNVIQSWLRELKRKYGLSTVFLHHAGHGGQSRGTTRREDLLSLVLELRLPKDYKASEGLRMELIFGKTRGRLSSAAEPLQLSLGEFNGQYLWDYRQLEDVRAAQVLEMSNEGASVREIAKAKDIPSSTVQRLLKKAQAQAKARK